MQGIKLNMMRKNKNARHKINMVRKKRKRKGCSKEKRGVRVGIGKEEKEKRKKNGPEVSPAGQKRRTGPVWSKEKKTEPVRPLYKGSGPVFSHF